MKLFVAAAVALLAAAPAFSSTVGFQVNFEKKWDFANGDVEGYYNGGTAADGTKGPNAGVSFVNVSGLSNDADFTYYTNAPSMLGTAYAHTFALSDRAFINVAGGVSNALSFFYSSPLSVVGAFRAFSGLNGTGILLGTFDLTANDKTGYDTWTLSRFAFNGIAESFDITASANAVALDNISATAVPEPATFMLMLAGVAAVGLRRGMRVA